MIHCSLTPNSPGISLSFQRLCSLSEEPIWFHSMGKWGNLVHHNLPFRCFLSVCMALFRTTGSFLQSLDHTVFSLVFILFGILWASWVFGFMSFIIFGNFFTRCPNIFSAPFSPSAEISVTLLLDWCYPTDFGCSVLLFVSLLFFPFFVSIWTISIDLTWGVPILSLVVSSLSGSLDLWLIDSLVLLIFVSWQWAFFFLLFCVSCFLIESGHHV